MRLTTCLPVVLPLPARAPDAFPRSQSPFYEGVGRYFPPGLAGVNTGRIRHRQPLSCTILVKPVNAPKLVGLDDGSS